MIRIKNEQLSLRQFLCLLLYYGFAQYLPKSNSYFGKLLFAKKIRYELCKSLFKSIGKNVNIERKAFFQLGLYLEIGDNSGLGINCHVPNNIKIGNDVMMGPNCYIFTSNHSFDRLDIPIWRQGHYGENNRTIIEDDVWIGRDVTFTVGRHVSVGTIIGACTLLCKDFPAYSIIGGNPSRLIKKRKSDDDNSI